MNAFELKKKWSEYESHALLAKYIIVENEDVFRIDNVRLTFSSIDKFGIHIEFDIEKITHFISISDVNLITNIDDKITLYQLSRIVVSQDNESLHLNLYTSNGQFIFKCTSMSMGPVHGFLISKN